MCLNLKIHGVISLTACYHAIWMLYRKRQISSATSCQITEKHSKNFLNWPSNKIQ